jgi:nifR3 family TIM-barrel protein
MKSSFWKKLKRPIMVLAPMSGVTNEAFRIMLLKFGRPDVFWTEFVPTEGLFSKGRKNILFDLKFTQKEHPIVAQIFGSKPEFFEKTAELARKLGFDGIDINMGCPNKDIEKTGAGASLIKNKALAKEIIRMTKKGAGRVPVSVKTRIGYSESDIGWIKFLLKEDLAALIIHFRTRKDLFKVPAHWELAKKIVRLRDSYSPETLLIGNGGVETLAQARSLSKETGFDGIMVGRGVLKNPWFFSERVPDVQERMAAVIQHAKIFEKLRKRSLSKGEKRLENFNVLKKYFWSYVVQFKGAKELRDKLSGAKSIKETQKTIKDFLKSK